MMVLQGSVSIGERYDNVQMGRGVSAERNCPRAVVALSDLRLADSRE